VLEKRLGEEDPGVAALIANMAYVHDRQGRYDEAERSYKRALSIREKSADAVEAAEALDGLAGVYTNQGRYGEAEQAAKRAISLRERALDPNHPLVAASLSSLGFLYGTQGRYSEAEAVFRRALAINEKALGREHAIVGSNLGNLGSVLDEQARYAEAEQAYQRALAIEEKALGPTHPQLAVTLNNLAAFHERLGRHDEAEALFKRALAIKEQRLSPDHPDVAVALNNLAVVYGEQGRLAEGEALNRRALAIREKVFGREHPDVAASLNNLADSLGALGRKQEQEPLLRRALAIREKTQGPNHPDVALLLANLAVLQFDEHARHDEAERLLKRALSIYRTALGPNHPDTAETLHSLGRNEARRGDHVAALEYARQASRAALAHVDAESGRRERQGEQVRTTVSNITFFWEHVDQLGAVARQQPQRGQILGEEAFEIAQWASQTAASAAIQQMAARFAAGGGVLGTIVRERQDLASLWREKEKALLAAIAKGEAENKTDLVRKEIEDLARRFGVVSDRLRREFPDFAALASPQPLKVEAVQKLLAADEAVIFWLVGGRETHVFAISRDSFDWATSESGGLDMLEKIAAFRRGLDVDQLMQSIDRSDKPVLFDLGLAHELYTAG
jgi:tetratricopeptide (TPR) repeat protein